MMPVPPDVHLRWLDYKSTSLRILIAIEALAAEGWTEAMSIAELARKAGVKSRGSVYLTMEEIAGELVTEVVSARKVRYGLACLHEECPKIEHYEDSVGVQNSDGNEEQQELVSENNAQKEDPISEQSGNSVQPSDTNPEDSAKIEHSGAAEIESFNTKTGDLPEPERQNDLDPDESPISTQNPKRKRRASATKTVKPKPEGPPKPEYWGDLVAAVINHFREAPGPAAKIAEQLAGVAPDKTAGGKTNARGGENNCSPAATPADIPAFVAWYRADHPTGDLPTRADRLPSWWHKFVLSGKAHPNGEFEKRLAENTAKFAKLREFTHKEYDDDAPVRVDYAPTDRALL